jgi:hypothetical protein
VDSYDYAGHQVVEKAGALAGVRTVMTLVPDKHAGIFVAANLNLTAFPEAVRAYYVNQLLGIDPATDQQAILALNGQIAKLVAPPPAPTNPGTCVGTRQSLVGVYENEFTDAAKFCSMGTRSRSNVVPRNIPRR